MTANLGRPGNRILRAAKPTTGRRGVDFIRRLIQQGVFATTPLTSCYGARSAALQFRYPLVARTARIISTARFYVGEVTIGENTFVGHAFRAYGGDGSSLILGQNCDVGPHVVILAGTHHIGSSLRRAGKGISTTVSIGDGAWVGGRVTIVGPCEIGAGCVIAAGCVVRQAVPAGHLYLGPDDVRRLA